MDKVTIIAVGSITNAIRAQKILDKYNIRSFIQRVSVHIPNRGCGYCLKINKNSDEAVEIIKKANIRVLEVVEELSDK